MIRAPFLRAVAALTAAALVLASSPAAFAQIGKESIAEGLFQEGRKLLDQGNVPAACQKFKASLDTDRTLGTLIALAACHEKEGKTASAWAEFTEAAALAKKQGKPDQETFAKDRIAALDKQLSRLTINATKVEGMEIRIDGIAIPLEGLGTALPVDPGERLVEATAPGYKPWSKRVPIASGTGSAVTVPPLEVDPNAPKEEKGKIVVINAEQPKGTDSTKLVVGAVVGGVGAVGVGVGAYLQFSLAQKQQDDAASQFRQDGDQARYNSAHDKAVGTSTIGITSMIIGGIALGAGVFLVVTSFRGGSEQPKPAQARQLNVVPVVGGGTNGLAMVGTF
jgi:hypothetical protein